MYQYASDVNSINVKNQRLNHPSGPKNMFSPPLSSSFLFPEEDENKVMDPFFNKKRKQYVHNNGGGNNSQPFSVTQKSFGNRYSFPNHQSFDVQVLPEDEEVEWEDVPEYRQIASELDWSLLESQRASLLPKQPVGAADVELRNDYNQESSSCQIGCNCEDDYTRETAFQSTVNASPDASHSDYSDFQTTPEHPIITSSVSTIQNRLVNLKLSNPFENHHDGRHKTARKTFSTPKGGFINGYIKFQLGSASSTGHEDDPAPKRRCSNNRDVAAENHPMERLKKFGYYHLPRKFLPELHLDAPDQLCWSFYRSAFCQGRTLLSGTNFWFNDILAMAQKDPCVRHALLALSGGYILDYRSNEKLQRRVNRHYGRATSLISQALTNPKTQDIGKGDNIVAAIVLLLVDDCVNWELRVDKSQKPNWLLAGRLAKSILDNSDPGYRYWKTANVQCSTARLAYSNWVALACILAEPVTPLEYGNKANSYGWLLQGTQKEMWKIQGGTGFCPKLLHIFSQITYLSSLIKECPSYTPCRAAIEIETMLQSFRQWSEVSEGYPTPEELLRSCQLDAQGKVDNAAKVTELTGQTWVSAAQLYLHCRFFRKPRWHPDVLHSANILLQCVIRMPYTGLLFTSQAPFFPIFLVSLISLPENRGVGRDWFETIVSGANCRSSVPPVWKAIQTMWAWLDATQIDSNFDESKPVYERHDWWEDMVNYLIATEGYVSLT